MSRDLKSNVGLRYDYLGRDDNGNDSWFIWSDETIVGSIGQRSDGTFFAKIDILGRAMTCRSVSSLASAKRFVERNWSRMLDQAGLQVKP